MERGRSRPEKRKSGELKQGSGREAERQRRVDRVAGEGWGEGGRGTKAHKKQLLDLAFKQAMA